ncbi:TPA: hypothetical protein KSK13_003380 [Clostridioides difficile]|nr:hypothetical protein [Clostridioides difficile]
MNDLDIEIKINELEKYGYFRINEEYVLEKIDEHCAIYRMYVKPYLNGDIEKELLIAKKQGENDFFYSRGFIEKNSVDEILKGAKKLEDNC